MFFLHLKKDFYRSVATLFLATISLILLLSQTAEATVTVTAATGGSAISADTNGTNGTGTFTILSGPVLTEGAFGDIGTGTIILNAPSGFAFSTTSGVTATVSNLTSGSLKCTGQKHTDLALSSTVTVTSFGWEPEI
jgi:hypothetical protein